MHPQCTQVTMQAPALFGNSETTHNKT